MVLRITAKKQHSMTQKEISHMRLTQNPKRSWDDTKTKRKKMNYKAILLVNLYPWLMKSCMTIVSKFRHVVLIIDVSSSHVCSSAQKRHQ